MVQEWHVTLTLTNDSVGSVTITNPGSGYTNTNPPIVHIGEPTLVREEMNVDGYSGDYGTIVGVGTTSTGSQEQLYFDMYIPVDSFMRDGQYVGTSVTVTTLGSPAGDYFTVYGTNISIGNTFASEDSSGSTIGIGTTALDNVYQVISTEKRPNCTWCRFYGNLKNYREYRQTWWFRKHFSSGTIHG